MKLRTVLWLCFLSSWLGGRLSEPLSADEPVSNADAIVQQALAAELSGDVGTRTRLLLEALEADPNCAAARWQLGFVRNHSQWQTIDEAARQAAEDPRMVQYARLRASSRRKPGVELALARWCRKERLVEQERWHWYQVLTEQPTSGEAMQKLGLKRRQGALLTEAEIRKREQIETKLAAWRTKVALWKQRLMANGDERENALLELRGVRDIFAIPALEAELSQVNADLGREVVNLVNEMEEPHASRSLTLHAVDSQFAAVRDLATDHLKKRELGLFIPMLMAGLQAPIEFRVQRTFGGVEFELLQEEPTAFHRAVQTHRDPQRILENFSRTTAENEQRNERIYSLLKYTTGETEIEGEPVAWWNWWKDRNELSFPKRTFTTFAFFPSDFIPPPHSCFMAGTPVWTETGKQPIEQIMPGDRVLAQNPRTGELGYKFVMRTTQGGEQATLRLTLDGEELVASRGHNFWVAGKGWRMAKNLSSADSLRGSAGPIKLDRVIEGAPADVFNLVVADWGTYFVGEHKVLTHDITMPDYVQPRVPGLQRTEGSR